MRHFSMPLVCGKRLLAAAEIAARLAALADVIVAGQMVRTALASCHRLKNPTPGHQDHTKTKGKNEPLIYGTGLAWLPAVEKN